MGLSSARVTERTRETMRIGNGKKRNRGEDWGRVNVKGRVLR
jgi:hypothetical protein